jgi:hypothetical protein
MRHLLPAIAALLLASPAAFAQSDSVDYSTFVPTTELFTGDAEPPDTALVQRLFTLAFTEPCGPAIDGGYGGPEPQVFDLSYRGSYDEASDPERKFRLYQFNCSGGAYNFSSVFYGWDEVDGLAPISFAAPSVKPEYEGEETDGDGKLVRLQVTGMTASFLVTNATVTAGTGAISSASYWRGIGDASSIGEWILRDGEYALVTYDVDASYDGEVNPVRVYDLTEPQDVTLPE